MGHKRFPKLNWILGLFLIFAALVIQPGGKLLANAQSTTDVASPGESISIYEFPNQLADAPPDSYTGTHVIIYFNDCAIHSTADCISASVGLFTTGG